MKASRPFILTYHSIDTTGSVISVTAETFAEHMRLLAASGRPVVPLEDVGGIPHAVAITFDDGFRNFAEAALPALRRYGFPATVFVVLGHVGGANDWYGQPPWVPRLPLMDWADLEEIIREGISVGSHTVSHPNLTLSPPAELERELRESKQELQERTGQPVRTFAYPYGAVNEAVRAAAARHFAVAVSTRLGYLNGGADPFQLPRIDTYYVNNVRWFDRLGSWPGELYVGARAALRSVRSLVGA